MFLTDLGWVYQGPVAAPKRTIRAVEVGVPSGGADGLPREDISGKLNASLLKNMSSADWKASSIELWYVCDCGIILSGHLFPEHLSQGNNHWVIYQSATMALDRDLLRVSFLTDPFCQIMRCFMLQVRQESLEVLNTIIEEANKRIQPTGTGDSLFKPSIESLLEGDNPAFIVLT